MKKSTKKIIICSITVVVAILIALTIFFYPNFNSPSSQGTQIKEHIGYFDEDVAETLPETTTNSSNELKNKDTVSSNKEAYDNFGKETEPISIQKETLSKEQIAIKQDPNTNNGEWLPPIKD